MKKFKRKKLLEFLGWNYVVNHNTKNIHEVKYSSERCNLNQQNAENCEYIRNRKVKKLLNEGYGICLHCLDNSVK